MKWQIFTSLLSVGGALIALAIALFSLRRSSVTAAQLYGELSQLERTERLTPSKLAELAEFREALQRAEALLEKVNRREIARAKPRADDGTYAKPNGAAVTKDELRMRAGLIAGRPAPHQ